MVVTLTPLASSNKRVSMFLWGLPGCGKTHLASTAPGKKLWINFDNEGTAGVAKEQRDNVTVLDYSTEAVNYVEQAKTVNPFNIEGILRDDPDITTVVVDSITQFVNNCVSYSVGRAPGSTFENPGPAGYGYRNRFTNGLVNGLLIATGKMNRHLIMIGHEGPPQTNEAGVIQSIAVMLGGTLQVDVPKQLSEVWRMQDTGTERRVTVRQIGLAKPMKTRMFDTQSGYDFISSTKTQPNKVTLEMLFKQWQESNYEKLQLPK